jgi:hypothetical protein
MIDPRLMAFSFHAIAKLDVADRECEENDCDHNPKQVLHGASSLQKARIPCCAFVSNELFRAVEAQELTPARASEWQCCDLCSRSPFAVS